ncbi:hypothetical protein SASPL_118052 [Salvia splendens]|uniref:PGG domain-containing protein n=1 Tax=Salvia splendens TaxID=180675 RepID=A0A8X8ZYC7_SALSN|nr:hypothetical protein SASPL_118052 [Salvia splendens]
MEQLQTKLFEAAMQNSITQLQQLLIDDPLILERALVNRFNETPLHVAAMFGHVDFVREIVVKYLVSMSALQVDVKNGDGLTAMDILIRSRRDLRDSEIEHLLKHGDKPAKKKAKKNSWNGLMKQHSAWLEKEKHILMVVASLIAAMAFQAGVNPPDGLWKIHDIPKNATSDIDPKALKPSTHITLEYSTKFYIWNTIAFISSLSIILLLTSGLPIRRRFFMWILMVITWIAISAIALSYLVTVKYLREIEGNHDPFELGDPQGYTLLVWTFFMFLLLVGHTVRIVVKLIKKLRNGWIKCTSSLC